MFLAETVDARLVFRQILGNRDGHYASDGGEISKAYFNAMYEMPDEAEARYQACKGSGGT